MKIFGLKIGADKSKTTNTEATQKSGLVSDTKKLTKQVVGHQLFFVILIVAAIVAVTSLQMLRYSDPPVDEAKAQENITKVKRIVIDEDVVNQINALRDTGVTAAPDINSTRTNPFNE